MRWTRLTSAAHLLIGCDCGDVVEPLECHHHDTLESMTSSSTVELLTTRELRAWRGMLRTHTTLVKALDAELESQHGLALTSYEVLMFLADSADGRMRMHEIASSVLLSRSGLTRLVDRLVRDGFVERADCPSDARGAFAVITPAGRDKLDAARATHLADVRRLYLDRLEAAEQDQLGDVWEKVVPGSAPPG
jgi:DNA-binding MarR family transcriptional regulator